MTLISRINFSGINTKQNQNIDIQNKNIVNSNKTTEKTTKNPSGDLLKTYFMGKNRFKMGSAECNCYIKQDTIIKFSVSKVNLEDQDLSCFNLSTINLYDSNLKNTVIDSGDFSNSEVVNCDFSGSVLNTVHFFKTNAKNSNFENSIFAGNDIRYANFSGANLKNAFMAKLNFNHTNLKNANMEGVNFIDSNLKNAIIDENTNFKNAIYDDRTIFPEGFNPEEKGMINFKNLSEEQQSIIKKQVKNCTLGTVKEIITSFQS